MYKFIHTIYFKIHVYFSESIVNLGSASVDNVSSGWQSTMSPRKECDIYILLYPYKF